MSKKIWTTSRADREFSKMIRERDGRCLKCGREDMLDCSHFWTRKYSSTRYNFNNCIALCRGCHFKWEIEKQGEYMDFMVKLLGRKKYKVLEKRAHTLMQRKNAIIDLMKKVGT